jgi:hypothetical protein
MNTKFSMKKKKKKKKSGVRTTAHFCGSLRPIICKNITHNLNKDTRKLFYTTS